jgi:hypothetical protein
MVLTKEQRIELLAKARAAKQAKNKKETPVVVVEPPPPEPPTPKPKSNKKTAPIPLPVPVEVVEESDEEVEEPVVVKPKKRLPTKWLKKQEEPAKVCCNEPLTKEEPLITDDKPEKKVLAEKNIVIPTEKELKKPRKPRASVRTLEIVAEPTPIEAVLEEVKNNDVKYRPVPKTKQPAPVPEVVIKHNPLGFTLFDY